MKGYRSCLILAAALALSACGRDDGQDQAAMQARTAGDCDPVRQRCDIAIDGLRLAVRMGPGVKALKAFPVRVWPGLPPGTRIDKFFVSFTMAGMDMGMNRYRLAEQPDGSWLAEVTLPICTSGRTDWIATIELHTDQGRWKVPVPFVLSPP